MDIGFKLLSLNLKSEVVVLVLVVLATGIMLTGCEGCRSAQVGPPVEEAYEFADAIPADAQVVAFADELGPMLEMLEWGLAVFPADLEGAQQFEAWHTIGARQEGPAATFWTDDQWVVMVDRKFPDADSDQEFDINDWPLRGERQILEEVDYPGWIDRDEQGQWTQWMSTDGRRLALGVSLGDGATALDQRVWALEEGQSWQVSANQNEVRSLGEAREQVVAYGAVDAGAFVSRLEGEGRAALLRDQMALRIGTVYFSLSAGGDDESLQLELLTPGGRDGTGALIDLGEAAQELPDLGGLARPGVPLVARLSTTPENFVNLFLTTLGPEDRSRVEETLDELRDELKVDLRRQFLDNITGQVALVVFSLEDEFFERSGVDLAASIFRLDATREALVLPFRDRDEIQLALDAFTQLSQGGLRRQAMEHTIQYAWFDDGALEWALILGDEHLVLVDSIVAFDHVRSWERSPRPLEGTFVDHGVDQMLSAHRGVGVYLDLATLRSLARESGAEGLTAWLRPVDAARIQSDIDGRREHSRLVIWPSSRALEEVR